MNGRRDGLAGVLLTGGASRRLGTDKARLVDEGGHTLAAHAAAALQAVCDRCIEVGDGHSGLPSVRESPSGSGPRAARLAGVDALHALDELGAAPGPVLLIGCDYPRLDAAALRAVATAEPFTATALATGGGRAHYVCARYDVEMLREARRRFHAGERALRWIETLPHTLVALAPGALHDVDTPADASALGLRAQSGS